jgi:DNA-binding LacI/PurR family transcriptional regulator
MKHAGLADAIDISGSGWGEEDGAAAARELLARPSLPTAVICCSDQSAAGFAAVMGTAGVKIPSELSVVGWDDGYLAALPYHQFASVRQDLDATAEASLDRLLRRMSVPGNPRRVVLTPSALIKRASSGPAALTLPVTLVD